MACRDRQGEEEEVSDYRDKTCQDCMHNVGGLCRANPPSGDYPIVMVTNAFNQPEWSPACSQFRHDYLPTFVGEVNPGDTKGMLQRAMTEDGQRAIVVRNDALIAAVACSISDHDSEGDAVETIDTEIIPTIDMRGASYLAAAFIKHFITKYRFSMEDMVDKVREICLKGELKTRKRKS